MAFDEDLADRIRTVLQRNAVASVEKKMFGGLSFMVGGNMCVGVIKEEMVLRVAPQSQEELLKAEGIRVMDFTHKPMKGWLMASGEALASEKDLEGWIQQSLAFIKGLPQK